MFDQYTGDYSLGMAPNSAGQSIVYTFGSVSSDDGATGGRVQAYNVSTNTWTFRPRSTHIYNPNGVGKIGNKLYFSGGYIEAGACRTPPVQLWAYDYSKDLMIRKAPLPIFSAEGVSGVINGKLYVLPGACNGNGYPSAGYCIEEQTRRFYRYDPVTNTWVARRPAPHFHRQGAAAVIDGKFYVAGGIAGFGHTSRRSRCLRPDDQHLAHPGSNAQRAERAGGAGLQGSSTSLSGGSNPMPTTR